MILYLLKSLICSGCLYLFYHLLLEKEKMYRFNRFYLLFSIIFSFSIPFLELKRDIIPEVTLKRFEPIAYVDSLPQSIAYAPVKQQELVNWNWPQIAMPAYLFISTLLLLRFFLNIYLLFRKVGKRPFLRYENAKLVLNDDHLGAHSFLSYIFLDKTSYLSGALPPQILEHELSHVRQKHTWDVLFIELLFTLAWFNPLLLVYRKAILLNHEFLADESVLALHNDTAQYQELLLSEILTANTLFITSKFNYSITKKRLIMMKKQPNTKTKLLKQLTLVPLLTIAAFAFCGNVEQVQAQQEHALVAIISGKTDKGSKKPNFITFRRQGAYTKTGISSNLMAEYQELALKFKFDEEHMKGFLTKGTAAEQNRMETIWKQMSLKQQNEQAIAFNLKMDPLKAAKVTAEQLQTWKNPTYGIWVNGKRINNETLANYQPKDFGNVHTSKLYGRAKRENRTYQVDLMTETYRKEFNERLKDSPDYYIVYTKTPYAK